MRQKVVALKFRFSEKTTKICYLLEDFFKFCVDFSENLNFTFINMVHTTKT